MTAVTAAARALGEVDPEVASAISGEEERLRTSLEMIASENYASNAVREAVGSVLTNKYAEGYPGKRYYAGNQYVDDVETLAIERAQSLFGVDHANVQPHSGAQANMAVYAGLLKPGEMIMGMALDAGGHLTHGFSVNSSGKIYASVQYGVDRETETLDYDAMLALAREHRPQVIVVGATAYPRRFDFARAREIADEVEAVLIADIAHTAGLVAGGAHPSPVGHAQVITTSTHKTLRGPRGGMILCDRRFARRVDRGVFPGTQGGPLMHVIAGKAVMLQEAATPQFEAYARQIVDNAQALAETLTDGGLRLISGGTDTHLVLADVTRKGLTGQQASDALERCGIIVNKNAIPFDEQPPAIASGIRIGTPALTTRGLGCAEMRRVGELIVRVIEAPDDGDVARQVGDVVRELCATYPAPGVPAA